MICSVRSLAINGIQGSGVLAECYISNGLPGFDIVGLPDAAVREGFTNPSIIVVGDVVKLRDRLGWFEKKPLFGRTIVVTRAREQASDSAKLFAERGARVIQFPTIKIAPMADYAELDEAVKNMARYGWVVFTSVNGVRFFRERLDACGLDARALGGVKVAAIGPATVKTNGGQLNMMVG